MLSNKPLKNCMGHKMGEKSSKKMENHIQILLYISMRKSAFEDLPNFIFRVSSNPRNFQNNCICKCFLAYFSAPFLASFFACFLADVVTLNLPHFSDQPAFSAALRAAKTASVTTPALLAGIKRANRRNGARKWRLFLTLHKVFARMN